MAAVRRAGGRFLPRDQVDSHGWFFVVGGGGGVPSRALAEVDAEAPAGRDPSPATAASATAARITPAVLFVTVVLAVVLLVSGLLHVLRRLFIKSNSAGGAAERQLQQLFFPPHEDGAGAGGLDQAAIDALPEFAYGELAAAGKGKAKEGRQFDCAVCLCEFADHDRLRLLPACGHAFHVACIDVWLRSSATCPLCRAALRRFAAAAAAAAASSGIATADASVVVEPDDGEEQKRQDEAPPTGDAAAAIRSVVLPVRLGRFKNLAGPDGAEASASPRLDGRRCFSMGSYQYVLSDEQLLVSVHVKKGANAAVTTTCAASAAGSVPASSGDDQPGKKVYARGDSFSVSKIWQWRGSQRRLPAGLCADDSLPWAPTASTATTKQERDT